MPSAQWGRNFHHVVQCVSVQTLLVFLFVNPFYSLLSKQTFEVIQKSVHFSLQGYTFAHGKQGFYALYCPA